MRLLQRCFAMLPGKAMRLRDCFPVSALRSATEVSRRATGNLPTATCGPTWTRVPLWRPRCGRRWRPRRSGQ
eukprot:5077408-Lingulodinium_polyedra.AAC.1